MISNVEYIQSSSRQQSYIVYRCIFVTITCIAILLLEQFRIVTKSKSIVFHYRKNDIINSGNQDNVVLSTTTSRPANTLDYHDEMNLLNNTTLIVDDDEDEGEAISSSILPLLSSCQYDVHDHQECLDILAHHMNTSLKVSRSILLSLLDEDEEKRTVQVRDTYVNRRWLLLGDSTVYHLHNRSSIQDFLTNESVQLYQQYRSSHCSYQHYPMECYSTKSSRCDRMETLNLTKPYTRWRRPNFKNGEGPHLFGLNNPYCSDCNGCDTDLITCTNNPLPDPTTISNELIDNIYHDQCTTNKDTNHDPQYIGPSYGGYMQIEFARDVELQSQQYRTTQENTLLNYIEKRWNTPIEMIIEFGYPICIVSVGLHDLAVPGISRDVYNENVKWYVQLLLSQCDYIIWVSNTCPLTARWKQTPTNVYDWNMDVKNILSSDEYTSKMFFLDVYNASKTYDHVDNLHMSDEWYDTLGSFFLKLMSMKLG